MHLEEVLMKNNKRSAVRIFIKVIIYIIVSIILLSAAGILVISYLDVKKSTIIEMNTKNVIKQSLDLTKNLFKLGNSLIEYNYKSNRPVEKRIFEGELYTTYPNVGENFGSGYIDNKIIDIINEMPESFKMNILYHYPSSAYPGEDGLVWFWMDTKSYDYYIDSLKINDNFSLTVNDLVKINYKIKNIEAVEYNDFINSLDLLENKTIITIYYPDGHEYFGRICVITGEIESIIEHN